VMSNLVGKFDITAERTFAAQLQTPGLATEQLGSRYAGAINLGVDMAVTRHLHLTLDYRLATLAYGQSAAVNGYFSGQYGQWFEPDSRTWTQAATVGVAWSL
jgi:hypothetical protein